MMKGFLFISNSTKPTSEQADNLIYNVGTFELAPIEAAKALGYSLMMGVNRNHPEIVKCKEYDIIFYDQHSYRSIFAVRDNWIAYKNLCRFLKEHPEIEVIHCNTPIGGFMGRICGHKFSIKKIIYTAHGFHFYKGAPLLNRTILKYVEIFLARWTDVIITMNDEDFQAAKKFKLKTGGKIFKVPGVGVINKDFQNISIDRSAIRKKLGIPEDAFVGIAMGDIVPRKNYKTAIKAIALVDNPYLHYLICGKGTQIEELKNLTHKLGISSRVHFLGFRTDIKNLALASDFFFFTSLQEGLPRSTMEAMACGLPCIVSNIRGNVDLIDEGLGGYMSNPNDANGFANSIKRLLNNRNKIKEMSIYNLSRIKQFDIEIVKNKMLEIYKEVL